MEAEKIVNLLRGRKAGTGWTALHPAHDDRTARIVRTFPGASTRDATGTAADIAAALNGAFALGGAERLCFPCRINRRPATPQGFKEAACDATGLRDFWRRHLGPLVGLATGEASGIDALDLDKGHSEANVWWAENRHRLPVTRSHRTRSGALHFLFRHTSALRCTDGSAAATYRGRAA
jgi:hypothetical protein